MSNDRTTAAAMTMPRFIGLTSTLEHSRVDAQARSTRQIVLKQGRHVHLYSGSPGRTVWAQSRQTNRPSLYAIIDLKSIPAMQYGQRMVKVVSVNVGIGRSAHEQWRLARRI